jgi:hypothetical protein
MLVRREWGKWEKVGKGAEAEMFDDCGNITAPNITAPAPFPSFAWTALRVGGPVSAETFGGAAAQPRR